ncbi:single-stranded DNA-binding protein [soil metagenome]
MAGETVLTIVGALTADPELRHTSNGLAVVNFTVASNSRTFDKATNAMKDGEPLFIRASAWRDFAEHIAGSLTKGTRVIVVGNLRQRTYETKEGEKRTSIELEVESVGPDLRWATAQVTRAASGGARAATTVADEPWATTTPGSSAGADVWNQPGTYSDETPF